MRAISFEILKKVLMERQYANLALKHVDHPNIALITQIVYGTLQNYRYCQYQWEPYVQQMPKKEIEILLTMSVYQHLFVDKLPDYAIVDEANKISRRLFKGAYQKLVNAVLRRTFSQPPRELSGDSNAKAAIQHSFKDWIINLWDKQYGHALMLDFASSSNTAPFLYVKENPFVKVPPATDWLWATDVEGAYQADRKILQSPAFKMGKYIVQDKNSQRVGHFVDAKPNDCILDACAAPGGKSMSMAIKMENKGEIIALDIHRHKIDLLQKQVDKTKLSIIKPHLQDATQAHLRFEAQSFDGVLVDAPCSGLGVLKRKPEIKHFIKPEDLDALVILQRDILASVATLVKVDGWLVYSTCTLNKKENEQQARWFLEQFPHFQQTDEQFLNPKKTCADGFYMVKFMRIR